MKAVVLILLIVAVVAGVYLWSRRNGEVREQSRLDDARADAQRWYERLGGQVLNLHGEDAAARQALADASERYNAAGGQLQQAKTVRQCELARETALEGLQYVRAARVAMGLDPGPELPPLAAARGVGQLTEERAVNVQGQQYLAGPNPGAQTPYFYPGGHMQGRPVPSGWYSTPWWKTALGTGAGVLGGMLIFDALFDGGFGGVDYGGVGYGAMDNGFLGAGGIDPGMDPGMMDPGGYQDAAADFGGASDGGAADFGDFGGGDFGGDFGGGGDW